MYDFKQFSAVGRKTRTFHVASATKTAYNTNHDSYTKAFCRKFVGSCRAELPNLKHWTFHYISRENLFCQQHALRKYIKESHPIGLLRCNIKSFHRFCCLCSFRIFYSCRNSIWTWVASKETAGAQWQWCTISILAAKKRQKLNETKAQKMPTITKRAKKSPIRDGFTHAHSHRNVQEWFGEVVPQSFTYNQLQIITTSTHQLTTTTTRIYDQIRRKNNRNRAQILRTGKAEIAWWSEKEKHEGVQWFAME